MRSISWWRPRVIPVLILVGMALFLNDQGVRRQPDLDLRDVTVVEGTVTAFDSILVDSTSGNRRRQNRVFTLTLAGHPDNVTFRLAMPPPGGVPEGARVRLEAVGADSALDRARRYPEHKFKIETVGLAVDGKTIYTAAGDVERARDASSGYRIVAVVCLLLGVGWAGFVLWRWRRLEMRGERES